MGAYLMLGGTGKTPTIAGSSTESKHDKWIPINSWSFSAARPVVSDGRVRRDRDIAGRPRLASISISKVIDIVVGLHPPGASPG